MTWVAVIMFPVVLIYQAWNYWVFRQRVGTPPAQETPEPQPATTPPTT